MNSSSDIPPDVRSWAEIDLEAIRHNILTARTKAGPNSEVMAIVKADAYGHGAARVAAAIASEVDMFGVANLTEAREIFPHAAGLDILLLGAALPGEIPLVVREGFLLSISNADEARIASAAATADRPAKLNFKIDTGMGRMGCAEEDAFETCKVVAALPNVSIVSISTHLPVADEDEGYTVTQLEKFSALTDSLHTIIPDAKVHSHNSGGVLGFGSAAGNIVRAGLMLYGSAYPSRHQSALQPSLTWKARIALVREVGAGRSISYGRTFVTPHPMRVATLPVGYADGFPRQASGRGAMVLVGGLRCPVLGRVTMDQIVVDVSAVEARAGDEAVIIGAQGKEEIFARELAEWGDTISWDIFTGIGRRVVRFYRDLR